MSRNWRIIHQESSVVGDIIAQVGSFGTQDGPITFTIENVETRETREVTGGIGTNLAKGSPLASSTISERRAGA